MSDKRTNEELEAEELDQDGEALPDRELMSWVTPGPLEGDVFPPDTDPAEKV